MLFETIISIWLCRTRKGKPVFNLILSLFPVYCILSLQWVISSAGLLQLYCVWSVRSWNLIGLEVFLSSSLSLSREKHIYKQCLQNTSLCSHITLAVILAVRPLFEVKQECQISSLCPIYLTDCWLIEVSFLRNASVALPTLFCPLIFIILTDLCSEEQPWLAIRRISVITANVMTLKPILLRLFKEAKHPILLKYLWVYFFLLEY